FEGHHEGFLRSGHESALWRGLSGMLRRGQMLSDAPVGRAGHRLAAHDAASSLTAKLTLSPCASHVAPGMISPSMTITPSSARVAAFLSAALSGLSFTRTRSVRPLLL